VTEDQAFELYQQGRAHMEMGDYAEAAGSFQESLLHCPHFKTLELLGECLFRADRPLEAIVPLAAATTLNEGARAPLLLAEVFLAIDQPHDARQVLRIALQRAPDNKKAKSLKTALDNLDSAADAFPRQAV
jgi:tetratricopeptide (TPR) repeat protein